jgi:acyl carrier protein
MGLESVEIVLALEEAFQIRFPRRIPRFPTTVGGLEDMVLDLRREQLLPTVHASVEDREVREVVRQVIAKELAIDSSLVTPDATLVGDLGVDA